MSAPLIPKDIEKLALRLAKEEAKKVAKARTVDGAEEIADRVKADAEAKGMTVKEYIEDLTRDPQGVQPPEGTSPTSAFWSYGIEHPDAPLNSWDQHFLDNRYIAEAWAKTQGEGVAQTLETTKSGSKLNAMYLWEPQVLKALGGAEQGFTLEWTRECWANISETYAGAAKGPVVVFAQYADTRSILYNRELPTLHTNPDVGLDDINFAYEAPEAWPKETRAEVGTNAARAQLQFNDPTKPHYMDPQTYPDRDPAERRAGLEGEFASVAAERAERAAGKEAQRTADRPTQQETAEAAGPTVEAPQPHAPAPSASVPTWQLGFTPKPVPLDTSTTSRSVESAAPPAPELGKESAGTGLG